MEIIEKIDKYLNEASKVDNMIGDIKMLIKKGMNDKEIFNELKDSPDAPPNDKLLKSLISTVRKKQKVK